ncbi:hypothetical protein [Halalkalibacter hemicellulosilyticus]|uniref:WXG100 family type VII secretion target n=1 Tax=Halalkalibacter hemicellulosilyticusJCM 9152 TaxID=1236971 RepID=W4QBW5_9BACI|nr:hypothetical protein [Halalkalibacter hemicellulosilyticus]GAE29510.1 hypothetical protein JCM9152_871 [Halalkalibacter hemicellulosilyticusJCM 9152]
MSKDTIIHDRRLQTAQAEARKLERSIDRAYSKCETLHSFVQSANWKGSARDSFLSYLDIIKQYHAELKEAAPLQTQALENIDSYKNNFRHHALVRKVKRL